MTHNATEKHGTSRQDLQRALLPLFAPLKPGLALAGCQLLDIRADTDNACGRLAFESSAGERFDVLILARKEGNFWERRSVHFHLRREGLGGQTLSPVSDKVLDALTLLVRKRESEHGAKFARRLVDLQAADSSPKMAVGQKVYLRIADRCQFNCIFCNATDGLDSFFLNPEAVHAALMEIEPANLSQVVFSGGEPTLVPQLLTYAKLAIERGARMVIVQTNGLRLAEDGFLDPFVPLKDKLGWGFSIHAASEAANRIVTGRKDMLATQWRALDKALAMGFGAMITTVATRHSLHELPELVARVAPHARNPRLHPLHLSYPIPNGNAWGRIEDMPDFNTFMPAMRAMLVRADALGVAVRMSESVAPPRCQFHRHAMAEALDVLDIYGNVHEINPTERRFAGVCNACAYRPVCAGVWIRYLERFGDDELEAVPANEARARSESNTPEELR